MHFNKHLPKDAGAGGLRKVTGGSRRQGQGTSVPGVLGLQTRALFPAPPDPDMPLKLKMPRGN